MMTRGSWVRVVKFVGVDRTRVRTLGGYSPSKRREALSASWSGTVSVGGEPGIQNLRHER